MEPIPSSRSPNMHIIHASMLIYSITAANPSAWSISSMLMYPAAAALGRYRILAATAESRLVQPDRRLLSNPFALYKRISSCGEPSSCRSSWRYIPTSSFKGYIHVVKAWNELRVRWEVTHSNKRNLLPRLIREHVSYTWTMPVIYYTAHYQHGWTFLTPIQFFLEPQAC